jgi:hypothetical protein
MSEKVLMVTISLFCSSVFEGKPKEVSYRWLQRDEGGGGAESTYAVP